MHVAGWWGRAGFWRVRNWGERLKGSGGGAGYGRGGWTPQNCITAAMSTHVSRFCSVNFLSPLPKEFREQIKYDDCHRRADNCYFKNTYLGGYKFKNNDNNCWHKVSSDDWIILKLKASPTLSPSPGKLLDTCSWPNGNMWNGSAGVPCSMDFWDNPNWPMYKGFTPALTC